MAIAHCLAVCRRARGVYPHEQPATRLASLQAMRPRTTRRDAAPPHDLTRDKVWEIERPRHALHKTSYQKCSRGRDEERRLVADCLGGPFTCAQLYWPKPNTDTVGEF